MRKPKNLTQNYQELADCTIKEVNFVSAFERVILRLHLSARPPIIVTCPKTESLTFPLAVGQKITAGLVRFRVLPNFNLGSERAANTL